MMPFDIEIIKKERDFLKARVAELEAQILGINPNIRECYDDSLTLRLFDLLEQRRESDEKVDKLEADKALAIAALHHYDSAHYHAETGLPCHADNVAFETLKKLEAAE
jgi:hypothetical protein